MANTCVDQTTIQHKHQLASDSAIAGEHGSGNRAIAPAPQYGLEQEVCFAGGTGLIKHCYPNSSTWFYVIEMKMGTEPPSGRIGPETTVLLCETEIDGLESPGSRPLHSASRNP